MALVTDRPVELHDGAVYVTWTYDDVTLILVAVNSHNSTTTKVGQVVVSSLGQQLFSGSVPAGDRSIPVPSKAAIRVDLLTIWASA